jgi:hypothetical protein
MWDMKRAYSPRSGTAAFRYYRLRDEEFEDGGAADAN